MTMHPPINPFIKKVIERIGVKSIPQNVPVRSESFATVNNCFNNVLKMVARYGGSACYGWAIFQNSIISEGIAHAVWKSGSDELIDITPWPNGLDNITFLPDETLNYHPNLLIDNIRINNTQNELVDDFIAVCEAESKLYALGNRVSENELTLSEPIAMAITMLSKFKDSCYSLIHMGGTKQSICFCGKTYYLQCHGKNLLQELDQIVKELKKY